MNRIIDNWISLPYDVSIKSAKKQGGGNIEAYQSFEMSSAIRFCKNFRTAIDIGAHIGIISYYLSRKFKEVHSFEIDPKLYDCMYKNINNRNVKNVFMYDYGLGEKTQGVDLIKTNKSFSTHVNPESVGPYKVRPLDGLPIKDLDFIKIDAEGYEPLIIKGAIKTILKYKPVILYERKQHAQRYGYSNDAVFEMLAPYGYTMLKKLGDAKKNAVIGVIR